MDLQTRVTTGTNPGMTWRKDALVQKCRTKDHQLSVCPTYKQGMSTIVFFLEDEYASENDDEDFMRGLFANSVRGVSFATRRVILNQNGHNFGMLWQTSRIQDIRRQTQQGTPDKRGGSTEEKTARAGYKEKASSLRTNEWTRDWNRS